jgi:DNA-binding response OmpR family regulator
LRAIMKTGEETEATMKTILMIEDDPRLYTATKDLLEISGYKVIGAGTLSDGLQEAERICPDLIILDILLPDGNGLRKRMELREKSGAPVLVMSAIGMKKEEISTLRAAGDDYLGKPYLTEELLKCVERMTNETEKINGPA